MKRIWIFFSLVLSAQTAQAHPLEQALTTLMTYSYTFQSPLLGDPNHRYDKVNEHYYRLLAQTILLPVTARIERLHRLGISIEYSSNDTSSFTVKKLDGYNDKNRDAIIMTAQEAVEQIDRLSEERTHLESSLHIELSRQENILRSQIRPLLSLLARGDV